MIEATHEVSNQVPELGDYNLYSSDAVLRAAVQRAGAQGHDAALSHYGERLGRMQTRQWARDANRHAPELESYDARGYRVDRVHFHPHWHQFLRMAFAHGMHCSAWAEPGPGAHAARAASYLLHGQAEAGSLCPITMTSAAIPLLRKEPWFGQVQDQLYSRQYDERDLPLAAKTGMMVGMGLTEKQGGSDLRGTATTASPVAAAGRGERYLLRGHKWFFSSPTSDAHLVLARHGESLSCFYVPRWTDSGDKNRVEIQRLKDKLGNRSNASAEVEFRDAQGILVGTEGRGIATLIEMAAYTRLDCVLGSTALLRQALVQALHHARHRRAFGRALADQELMRCVLLDLAIESEAATVLALRLAAAFDGGDEPLQQAYRRILTPAAKFWVCKRTEQAVAECMEVCGGNGYIEDGPMPRLYREAPVNSIWEGSGNIMCLDVLRALKDSPEAAGKLLDELARDSAGEPLLTEAAQGLISLLRAGGSGLESAARHVARDLVLLVQAGLLRRHAPQAVADIFVRTRFGRAAGVFGVGIPAVAEQGLLERAWTP
ncbi:acyl-CoA dehydrogenase family protein [Candidimonas nitroreducens]|uniref:Acyl-CoA dehydrogenase n=1 Tax=Candidimonas nitroreducens TaxID=683354 RepID=A0A225MH17_9BURK|nr:acyl-CoA dehydrogenase family protein [Candidimonas nitroreducens]OWT60575.1 acyl-CoA dehydrogenase [Candidimonas nitroreducens]